MEEILKFLLLFRGSYITSQFCPRLIPWGFLKFMFERVFLMNAVIFIWKFFKQILFLLWKMSDICKTNASYVWALSEMSVQGLCLLMQHVQGFRKCLWLTHAWKNLYKSNFFNCSIIFPSITDCISNVCWLLANFGTYRCVSHRNNLKMAISFSA